MSADAPERPEPHRSTPPRPSRRTRLVIVGAVVLAVILWLILRGGGDNGSKKTQSVPKVSNVPPVALDLPSIKDYAHTQSMPIYWIGPQHSGFFEVTRTNNGSAYVRYLPKGVKAGDKRKFLTIGSYPDNSAQNTVASTAAKNGAKVISAPNGAEAAPTSKGSSPSYYMAFPNTQVLVEVYDPHPGRALKFVRSGRVVRVH